MMRKLRCPNCKTLRYTTSQEENWKCRACGAKLRRKPKKNTAKDKGRMREALGYYDI